MGPYHAFCIGLSLFTGFNLLSLAQDNRPPDPNNHFINPPLPGNQSNVNATVYWENKNWTVGSPANSIWNWVTNKTNLGIVLQQEGNSAVVQSRWILDCPQASLQDNIYWDGEISPIDLADGNIAFLAAYDCDTDSTPLFFSHYVNLTEPEVVSSSTASETSSTSSTENPTLPTNTSPSSTTDAAAASSATGENQNSDGSGGGGGSNVAALAGGIGGGIGGALLICAIVAIVLWQRRARRKDRQRAAEGAAAAEGGAGGDRRHSSGVFPYKDSPVLPVAGELEANEVHGFRAHQRQQQQEDYNGYAQMQPKYELDSSTSNSHSQR